MPRGPKVEPAVQLHRPVAVERHRIGVLRSAAVGERTPADPTLAAVVLRRYHSIDEVLGDRVGNDVVLCGDLRVSRAPRLHHLVGDV